MVREEDCVGCALCYNVCPVDSCIEMVELPQERSSVTWKELTSSRPEIAEWEGMERYREEKGIEIH